MNKKHYKQRSDQEKARASALASLAMREHSVHELKDKLTNKGYEIASIELIIDEYTLNNYLNDQRFAEIYWRSRSNRGFGPNKILMELKRKGIDSLTAQDASQQDELDFYQVIERVYEKKYKGSEIIDFKDKIKRQSYLYQRGFDTDMIRSVINSN